MSSSQNRKNNKTVIELEKEITAIKELLQVLISGYHQLSAAHNYLQGFLIALGVIPESVFTKPTVVPNTSSEEMTDNG